MATLRLRQVALTPSKNISSCGNTKWLFKIKFSIQHLILMHLRADRYVYLGKISSILLRLCWNWLGKQKFQILISNIIISSPLRIIKNSSLTYYTVLSTIFHMALMVKNLSYPTKTGLVFTWSATRYMLHFEVNFSSVETGSIFRKAGRLKWQFT